MGLKTTLVPLTPLTLFIAVSLIGTPAAAGTLAVGDRVWIDHDGDGIQDDGEPGASGVLVELRLGSGVVQATAVSDADGSYGFQAEPGLYYLTVKPPDGVRLTLQNQGGDDGLDSDAYQVSQGTGTFALDDAGDAEVWDFGVLLDTVGGRVWLDAAPNRIQDPSESNRGVPGVVVQLLDGGGAFLAETVTDEDGVYRFRELERGATYRVRFVVPPNRTLIEPNEGADDLLDSDPDPTSGETETFTLETLNDAGGWDAGLFVPYAGDRVWLDANANGIQDDGEPGLAGVGVRLNGTGGYRSSDANGNYRFLDLDLDSGHTISVDVPDDFVLTLPDRGPDDRDSDGNEDRRIFLPAPIGIAAGTNTDFGLVPAGTVVGGFAWFDLDLDGEMGRDEPRIPGVPVELFTEDGTLLGERVTGPDGRYRFGELSVIGSYRLRFQPETYFIAPPGDDNDADPQTGETVVFGPLTVDDADGWSVGLTGTTIGGEVWIDFDADGVRGPSETGGPEIDVDLLDASGALLASTTTIDRMYRFLDVFVNETYRVRFHLPPSYRFTAQDVGDDDTLDSDVDPDTGWTEPFMVAGPADALIWDAGLLEFADSVGDRVWLDEDMDGRQDPFEPGAPGITVELLDASRNLLASVTTDEDGSYGFHDLTFGSSLIVRVLPPPDWRLTRRDFGGELSDSDFDPVTGEVALVLTRAAFGVNVDAGLVSPRIGDRVWEDADDDGFQDPGESGRSGVVVQLLDDEGAVIEGTVSGSGGHYGFNLAELGGTYRLRFVLPSGHRFSPRDATGDAADSDVDDSGLTAEFVLDDDADRTDWDAGVVPLPTTIGGRVFVDLDEDGIDEGDLGRPGVNVALLGSEGQTLATQQTDAEGAYSFRFLAAQAYYRLRFTAPTGYYFAPRDAGDDLVDSDVDPLTGETETFLLTDVRDPFRWSAGLIGIVSAVGDQAWDDLDLNGIRDPGEPGLPGVTLQLRDGTGQLVQTVVTDADGRYRMTGLTPGESFRLHIVPVSNRRPTLANQGSDDLVDSDVDPATGYTESFVLSDPSDRERWDVGFEVGHLSVGDRCWEDADADGVQDAGESGLGGIQVELLDEDGVAATAFSGEDGSYAFDGLLAGRRFRLRFAAPIGYRVTRSNATGDEADSDAHTLTGLTEWFDVSEADMTRWDAGFVSLTHAAGDRVWKDANGNGVQDPREPGVAGVQVLLFRSNGQVIDIRATDTNGIYGFVGLFNAAHYVQFVAPPGFAFTVKDQGDDDERDSDAASADGRTTTFTPTGDVDATRWDAGLVHDCPYPDQRLEVSAVSVLPTGETAFELFDPNDPARVTGYRARRTSDAEASIADWPIVEPVVAETIWNDPASPAPGVTWFYQFAAGNAACDAEGPW